MPYDFIKELSEAMNYPGREKSLINLAQNRDCFSLPLGWADMSCDSSKCTFTDIKNKAEVDDHGSVDSSLLNAHSVMKTTMNHRVIYSLFNWETLWAGLLCLCHITIVARFPSSWGPFPTSWHFADLDKHGLVYELPSRIQSTQGEKKSISISQPVREEQDWFCSEWKNKTNTPLSSSFLRPFVSHLFHRFIFEDNPLTNFDTFPAAIMTVFQVWK